MSLSNGAMLVRPDPTEPPQNSYLPITLYILGDDEAEAESRFCLDVSEHGDFQRNHLLTDFACVCISKKQSHAILGKNERQ
jgi:hypothetical protein